MSRDFTGSRIAPMCVALVLADTIWSDPQTQKRTILGTFSSIFATKLPAVITDLAVHCILTGGHGLTEITLRFIDADEDEEPIVHATTMVDFSDPRAVAEMDFYFRDVTFPVAGEYRVQIYGAGDFIMERRLSVINVSAGGQSNA